MTRIMMKLLNLRISSSLRTVTDSNPFIFLQMSFVVALVSVLGSLYFSEVMNFLPCTLCWYQRVCMIPLVLIFLVGLWRNDEEAVYYGFPLSLIGLMIAIFHNLLYFGIIPEAITPCDATVSCSAKQLELFGFITIPLLAFISFLVINVLGLIQIGLMKNRN